VTFAAAWGGIVLGDNLAYAAGRLGGEWTEQHFGRSLRWQEALARFRQRGATTVFLTRWLFTAIGSVVAMIAGISRFGWGRFLLVGAAGKLVWVLIYWSIGWALGSQWQAGVAVLSANSRLILLLSLGVIVLVVGGRAWLARRRATPLAASPLPDPTPAGDA
jgi:membrane protein DedA with SNARE-associated domain